MLGDDARARIRALAENFPQVWQDERIAPIERKRIVALLIEDVTLVKADRIAIHVRFRGGRTTSLEIDKPKPIALIRKTLPEVVKKVDELLENCTDRQVAETLNELGCTNWRGQSFTHKKVIVIRAAYHLKSRFERLRERGMLTANELAAQLGVCEIDADTTAADGDTDAPPACRTRWQDGGRDVRRARIVAATAWSFVTACRSPVA